MSNRTYFVSEYVTASKTLRFINFIVDYIVIYAIFVIFVFILSTLSVKFNLGMENFLSSIAELDKIEEYLLGIVLNTIYYFSAEAMSYRTIGKLLTGTIVVDEEGNPPTIGQILQRTLCRSIPFDGLSFLGEFSRGWHDSISETYVVVLKDLKEDKQNFYAIEELGSIGEPDDIKN